MGLGESVGKNKSSSLTHPPRLAVLQFRAFPTARPPPRATPVAKRNETLPPLFRVLSLSPLLSSSRSPPRPSARFHASNTLLVHFHPNPPKHQSPTPGATLRREAIAECTLPPIKQGRPKKKSAKSLPGLLLSPWCPVFGIVVDRPSAAPASGPNPSGGWFVASTNPSSSQVSSFPSQSQSQSYLSQSQSLSLLPSGVLVLAPQRAR